ncbi:hypothetical protein F5Y11DRAFT_352490 [Daldinia sp. FL1419]|nr:hypothetical protein F5Y11DRAFT_352490 [Daldinia sp. FL1419]
MQSDHQQSDNQQLFSPWGDHWGRPRNPDVPVGQIGRPGTIPETAWDPYVGAPVNPNSVGVRVLPAGEIDQLERHTINAQRNRMVGGTYRISDPDVRGMLADYIGDAYERYRNTLSGTAHSPLHHHTEHGRPLGGSDYDGFSHPNFSTYNMNRPSTVPAQPNRTGGFAAPDMMERTTRDVPRFGPCPSNTSDNPQDVMQGIQLECLADAAAMPGGGYYSNEYANRLRQYLRENANLTPPSEPPSSVSSVTAVLDPEGAEPVSNPFSPPEETFSPPEQDSEHQPAYGVSPISATLRSGFATPFMTSTTHPLDNDNVTNAGAPAVGTPPGLASPFTQEPSIANGSPPYTRAAPRGAYRPTPIPINISIIIDYDDSVFSIEGCNVTARACGTWIGEELAE